MLIEIKTECADCSCGKTEVTVSGVGASGPWVEYVNRECPECDGTGIKYYFEEYDSVAEAEEDYSSALSFKEL